VLDGDVFSRSLCNGYRSGRTLDDERNKPVIARRGAEPSGDGFEPGLSQSGPETRAWA
jgi:hypothetical protein